MKRNSLALVMLATMVVFTSCQGQTGAQKLAVENFEKKLKETPERIILDVRTSDEFSSGHLSEAVLLDIYARDFRQRVNQLDKSKPVFVYCASGVRSNSAAKILWDAGFREIYDLKGGFSAWAGSGKPFVK